MAEAYVTLWFKDNGLEVKANTTNSSACEVFEKLEGQSWNNVATPALSRLSDLVWQECQEREGGGLPK